MRDPNIEDISCNGVNIPIYIWHRKYESIPTNITFLDDEYLNEYVMKLAHMAGKHISIAFPIVDAMLPGKHRLAATFGREVSVKGPTFTIRKFRERPFSPVELIMGGTLNNIMAAYLWTLIEHGKTALIAGGTGTGKSFPGETLVITRIDGEMEVIRADKLYDMVESKEYLVGEHFVKDVDSLDIRVLSIGPDYRLQWKRVKKVIRHKDSRPLVKVRTASSTIVTTLDHNFIKLDPETLDLVAVRASDLKPGDLIVNAWLDIDYPISLGLNPGVAYLVGIIKGSQVVVKNSRDISIYTDDIELANTIVERIEKTYGIRPSIYLDKIHSKFVITFRSEELYKVVERVKNSDLSLGIPPEILFNRDKSILLEFLAGLIDARGVVIERNDSDNAEPVIEIPLDTRCDVNGISFLLKRLRIKHFIDKRGWYSKGRYYIRIYGDSAIKTLTLIKGSSKLARLIRSPGKQYRGSRDKYGVYSGMEYVNLVKAGSQTYKAKLLSDGDIYLEKVISIDKVKPRSSYLYDLEVEDTHNFIIGQLGWRLNHNTTLLNAISLFIKPGMKIVSVEDTPELNLPHTNWVQLTSRESYVVGMGGGTEIKLFDLVKLSLRYRPDYIIVGEVRGEEAFVLFQAMATGHGGLSTLHAETLDYAIKRLTSPPMNIPKTYMKLMNVFIHINRVITRIEKGVVRVQRRISILQEVEDYDKYITIAEWDPKTDQHKVYLERSIHLRDIAVKRGLDLEDIIEEIYRKATVLKWLAYRNITNVWDVSRIIFNYYYDPETIYKRAVEELHRVEEELGVEAVVEKPIPAATTPTIATTTASLEVSETERLVSRTEVREDITRELFGRTRELRRR